MESVVLHKMEVDRLHTALSLLAPEERALIQALFFEEKTERQYADELGVYRNAVHVRKMKVLKKLNSYWRTKLNQIRNLFALIMREVPFISFILIFHILI